MKVINEMDLFRINESILKRVNKELTYHGLETAYIVFRILNKLKYSKKYIYNVTSLAFLHDIGAYKTDIGINLKQYHIIDTIKHSIYGYGLLKHTDLFREDSSMILYHHHSYNDRHMLIDDIPINEEAFLISLGDTVSLASSLLGYDEGKILKHINNIDKNRFPKKYYNTFMKLIEEGLIKEIVSGDYKKHFINNLASNIKMDKRRIEKYIILLPLSIDFFSFETSIHTVGVYCISKKLCKKLNISKGQEEKIKIGALLHDLGKVCIPKTILEKESSLSKEEYEIMKKHVVYTKEILEDADIDREIIHLACSHHEKLDGSGYPNKLNSEELSIGARVIAIADIFCALSEKRHYKKSFSKDKVISIFLDLVSKKQLDKDIVDILISNYDEVLSDMIIETNKYKEILNNMIRDYEKLSRKMEDLIIV